MAHFRVAKRYAKGLIDFLASSPEKEEVVMKEVQQIGELIKTNKELKNFFSSPVIENKKMIKIVNQIFKDYTEETKTFLALVIKQGRSEAIESISSEFMRLYRKKHKIVKATITSAAPLEDSQINSIIEKAKTGLPEGTTVEVQNRINPDLIGGFILRLGDTQVDASIRTKLDTIKKEFDSKQQYIPKI